MKENQNHISMNPKLKKVQSYERWEDNNKSGQSNIQEDDMSDNFQQQNEQYQDNQDLISPEETPLSCEQDPPKAKPSKNLQQATKGQKGLLQNIDERNFSGQRQQKGSQSNNLRKDNDTSKENKNSKGKNVPLSLMIRKIVEVVPDVEEHIQQMSNADILQIYEEIIKNGLLDEKEKVVKESKKSQNPGILSEELDADVLAQMNLEELRAQLISYFPDLEGQIKFMLPDQLRNMIKEYMKLEKKEAEKKKTKKNENQKKMINKSSKDQLEQPKSDPTTSVPPLMIPESTLSSREIKKKISQSLPHFGPMLDKFSEDQLLQLYNEAVKDFKKKELTDKKVSDERYNKTVGSRAQKQKIAFQNQEIESIDLRNLKENMFNAPKMQPKANPKQIFTKNDKNELAFQCANFIVPKIKVKPLKISKDAQSFEKLQEANPEQSSSFKASKQALKSKKKEENKKRPQQILVKPSAPLAPRKGILKKGTMVGHKEMKSKSEERREQQSEEPEQQEQQQEQRKKDRKEDRKEELDVEKEVRAKMFKATDKKGSLKELFEKQKQPLNQSNQIQLSTDSHHSSLRDYLSQDPAFNINIQDEQADKRQRSTSHNKSAAQQDKPRKKKAKSKTYFIVHVDYSSDGDSDHEAAQAQPRDTLSTEKHSDCTCTCCEKRKDKGANFKQKEFLSVMSNLYENYLEQQQND